MSLNVAYMCNETNSSWGFLLSDVLTSRRISQSVSHSNICLREYLCTRHVPLVCSCSHASNYCCICLRPWVCFPFFASPARCSTTYQTFCMVFEPRNCRILWCSEISTHGLLLRKLENVWLWSSCRLNKIDCRANVLGLNSWKRILFEDYFRSNISSHILSLETRKQWF